MGGLSVFFAPCAASAICIALVLGSDTAKRCLTPLSERTDRTAGSDTLRVSDPSGSLPWKSPTSSYFFELLFDIRSGVHAILDLLGEEEGDDEEEEES